MGLFARGGSWYFHVEIHGVRYRRSAKTKNKTEAWRKMSRFVASVLGPAKVGRIPRNVRRDQIPSVYVFSAGDFYKIGFSGNPLERLKDVQSGCPFPVTLVYQWARGDAATIEAELHERFKGKRLSGEWFGLDAADIEHIQAYFRRRLE